MKPVQTLKMEGTDPGSKTDVPKWCARNNSELLGMEEAGGVQTYYIKKN